MTAGQINIRILQIYLEFAENRAPR